MKIDRFCRQGLPAWVVKPVSPIHAARFCALWAVVFSFAATPTHPIHAADASAAATPTNRGDAALSQVLNRLTQGPAFNAKIRKRVWTSGQEAVGIGTYEQAGQSSGNYNLQITMHDGDGGKHTLQQISDGRLAWTRTDIAGSVLLRRVDVRILEQRVREADATTSLPPRVLVGGMAELIDSIRRDYDLNLKPGAFQLKSNSPSSVTATRLSSSMPTVDKQKFLVVAGELKPHVREQIMLEAGREDWPSLCPSRVQVLITTRPDPEFNFGEGLPRRIYFFSDPPPVDESGEQEHDNATPVSSSSAKSEGPLISLIELYSVQPINTPLFDRFTFESRDDDNNYVNETERYLKRYGL